MGDLEAWLKMSPSARQMLLGSEAAPLPEHRIERPVFAADQSRANCASCGYWATCRPERRGPLLEHVCHRDGGAYLATWLEGWDDELLKVPRD